MDTFLGRIESTTVTHCKKYPYIYGYFVVSFSYFNIYWFRIRLYPQIDGIMKPGPTLQCGSGLHYSIVDLRIQTHTESAPLKCGKLATKYPRIYEYFYSADAVTKRVEYKQCFAHNFISVSGREWLKDLHGPETSSTERRRCRQCLGHFTGNVFSSSVHERRCFFFSQNYVCLLAQHTSRASKLYLA